MPFFFTAFLPSKARKGTTPSAEVYEDDGIANQLMFIQNEIVSKPMGDFDDPEVLQRLQDLTKSYAESKKDLPKSGFPVDKNRRLTPYQRSLRHLDSVPMNFCDLLSKEIDQYKQAKAARMVNVSSESSHKLKNPEEIFDDENDFNLEDDPFALDMDDDLEEEGQNGSSSHHRDSSSSKASRSTSKSKPNSKSSKSGNKSNSKAQPKKRTRKSSLDQALFGDDSLSELEEEENEDPEEPEEDDDFDEDFENEEKFTEISDKEKGKAKAKTNAKEKRKEGTKDTEKKATGKGGRKRVLTELDQECGICFSKKQDQGNFIIRCDTCGEKYHRKCHNPVVQRKSLSWKCSNCSRRHRKRKLSSEQDVENPEKKKIKKEIEDGIECSSCFEIEPKGAKNLSKCITCGRYFHFSCLSWTPNLIEKTRTYPWQCGDCKECSVCNTIGDEEKMVLCDSCDRGYHTDCLVPPLEQLPEGEWFCAQCI